ncbi:MAG: hypothetical protein HKP09_04920 [Enterobacterales bacterium]|nr:hypothetical protein [Enterobacterales bacterium]
MKILKNKYLLSLFSIIALIIIFLNLMPKAIDMDLGKIGDGQVSVVFVYDSNLAVSNKQAVEINKAQEIIGDKVNFLVANIGDPKTEDFRVRYQARTTDILIFNSKGELIDRKMALVLAEDFIEITSGI